MNYVVIANSMADIEILGPFAVDLSGDPDMTLLNYFKLHKKSFPLAVFLGTDDWSIGSPLLIRDHTEYQLVSIDIFKHPHLYPEYFI